MRFVIALALLMMLSGCVPFAPPLNVNDPAAVALAVQRINDPHQGLKTDEGPPIQDGNFSYFMRRLKTQGQTIYQVYGVLSVTDWAFINSAYSNGHALVYAQIDRDVGYCSTYGCNLTEQFAANVTYAQLRAAQNSGKPLEVEFVGKNAKVLAVIPAAYIKGFFDGIKRNGG